MTAFPPTPTFDLPNAYILGRLRHSDLDNLFLRADEESLALVLDEQGDLVPRMRRDLDAALANFAEDFSPRPLLERLKSVPEEECQEILAEYEQEFQPALRRQVILDTAERFFGALAIWRAQGGEATFVVLRVNARSLRDVLGALPRCRWIP